MCIRDSPVVPAGEIGHLVGEEGPERGQILLGPAATRVRVGVGRHELRLRPAGAQPQVEPAAGEPVQGAHLLRQVGRRHIRQVDHRDAQPDPRRGRSGPGQRDDRVEHALIDRRQVLILADEQPLERPQAVIAELLGALRDRRQRFRLRPRAGHRTTETDQHGSRLVLAGALVLRVRRSASRGRRSAPPRLCRNGPDRHRRGYRPRRRIGRCHRRIGHWRRWDGRCHRRDGCRLAHRTLLSRPPMIPAIRAEMDTPTERQTIPRYG